MGIVIIRITDVSFLNTLKITIDTDILSPNTLSIFQFNTIYVSIQKI